MTMAKVDDGWIDKSQVNDEEPQVSTRKRLQDIWTIYHSDTDQDVIAKKRQRSRKRNLMLLILALLSSISAIVLMPIGMYDKYQTPRTQIILFRVGAFFAAVCCLCLLLSFDFWFEYVTACFVTVIEDREEIQSGCVKTSVEVYRELTGPPVFLLPIASFLCFICAASLLIGYFADNTGKASSLLIAAEITGLCGALLAIFSFQGIKKLCF